MAHTRKTPGEIIVFTFLGPLYSSTRFATPYPHPHPRCWFPCIDHASVLISYDVTIGVTSPKISAAFNGRLLETTTLEDDDDAVNGHDVNGHDVNGGVVGSRIR